MNRKMFSRITIAIMASLMPFPMMAQPEMADTMRSEGKIYVLVAIILVILAGMTFYLLRLDRKISRMETTDSEKKPS